MVFIIEGDDLKRSKTKARISKNVKYIALLTVLFILIWAVIGVDSKLRVITQNYANNRAKIIANNVINKTVNDYLEASKIKYSDLMLINTSTEVTVPSVEVLISIKSLYLILEASR